MNLWPIGLKPLGINFARLRPFGSYESETFVQSAVPWSRYQNYPAIRRAAAFGFPPRKGSRTALSYERGGRRSAAFAIGWDRKRRMARSAALAWASARDLAKAVRVPYVFLKRRSRAIRIGHSSIPAISRRIAVFWRIPAKRDRTRAIFWGRPARRDRVWRVRWRRPYRRPRFWRIPWGAGETPPPGVRPVPVDPPDPAPIPPQVYDPPSGDEVNLDLYCLSFDGAGNQVPLRIARAPCPGLHKRVFIVDNSIYVKRVSDDAAIHAESLSMSFDYESFAWSMVASLSGEAALDLVRNEIDPVEIEVGINGYVWRFYVEDWSRNDEFNETSITIQGRSLSAELHSPYALPASRLETDTLTARQIIEQELGTSGWIAEPHSTFVDWTIPGNVFDYNDMTPIDAITKIASSVGARVLCDRWERKIILIPRYPYSAWDWPTSPIDTQLAESQVVQDSGGWDPRPLHRGIYVNGERDGVITEVLRTGSNGAPWLQSITDPLITEFSAGRERGRNELSATGKRRLITRSAPIMSGQTDPGLLEPGMLVEVSDVEETWRGLVIATNVNATFTNQGLTVWQRIDFEVYDDA